MAKQSTIESVYDGLLESVRRVDNFPKEQQKEHQEEQIVYKLKHKGTNLYFDPKGYVGNVSEMGKVYSNKKPPRQSFICVPVGVEIKTGFDLESLPKSKHYDSYKTELDDWIVEEFKLVQINKGE